MTMQEASLKVSFEMLSETFHLIKMRIKGVSSNYKDQTNRHQYRASYSNTLQQMVPPHFLYIIQFCDFQLYQLECKSSLSASLSDFTNISGAEHVCFLSRQKINSVSTSCSLIVIIADGFVGKGCTKQSWILPCSFQFRIIPNAFQFACFLHFHY